MRALNVFNLDTNVDLWLARVKFDPNGQVNRSTPLNRNVSSNNRGTTNNVIDEVEEQKLNYVYILIGNEKVEYLIDTGRHKGFFTTANGQPLEVMDKGKTLKIDMNEVESDVLVANDLQHECLVGLDFIRKVEGTKTKIKEEAVLRRRG
ncbi:unnamed protein product [Brachionus calyciflorus]|uniref:Uncharacterized protein n=1 Tax=Brachionus calyciflorus TaxID=104777 RepID=A0A814NF95_9BILA|nr:unnamed protein product [Brachionus calyciflorus]